MPPPPAPIDPSMIDNEPVPLKKVMKQPLATALRTGTGLLQVHIPGGVVRGRREVREDIGMGGSVGKLRHRAESISSTNTAHSFAETDSNPSSPTSITSALSLPTPSSTTSLQKQSTNPAPSSTTSVRFRETVSIEHTFSKSEYDRRPSIVEPLTRDDVVDHLIFRRSLPVSAFGAGAERSEAGIVISKAEVVKERASQEIQKHGVELEERVGKRLLVGAAICARDATLGVLFTDLVGIREAVEGEGFVPWW
ncbi:hypothetical protein HDU67_006925 [Dinochytrium kinnereticum]|nr:hypothetical protein HDU67_006925 [Dinochytrium kinnereticum]